MTKIQTQAVMTLSRNVEGFSCSVMCVTVCRARASENRAEATSPISIAKAWTRHPLLGSIIRCFPYQIQVSPNPKAWRKSAPRMLRKRKPGCDRKKRMPDRAGRSSLVVRRKRRKRMRMNRPRPQHAKKESCVRMFTKGEQTIGEVNELTYR